MAPNIRRRWARHTPKRACTLLLQASSARLASLLLAHGDGCYNASAGMVNTALTDQPGGKVGNAFGDASIQSVGDYREPSTTGRVFSWHARCEELWPKVEGFDPD
jgi:hypothetical protein